MIALAIVVGVVASLGVVDAIFVRSRRHRQRRVRASAIVQFGERHGLVDSDFLLRGQIGDVQLEVRDPMVVIQRGTPIRVKGWGRDVVLMVTSQSLEGWSVRTRPQYLPFAGGPDAGLHDALWIKCTDTSRLAAIDVEARDTLLRNVTPRRMIRSGTLYGTVESVSELDSELEQLLALADCLMPPKDLPTQLVKIARSDPIETYARRALRALIDADAPQVAGVLDSDWPSVRAAAADHLGRETDGHLAIADGGELSLAEGGGLALAEEPDKDR